MPIARSGPVALALSGGGFRATFFHLGVLKHLRASGHLARVRTVAAVSGGSILAAHLLLRWKDYVEGDFERAAEELRHFARRDVRGRVVRRWLLASACGLPVLSRRWRLTAFLEREYEFLFRGAMLRDLPLEPKALLLATSLSSGRALAFTREGFRVAGAPLSEGGSMRLARAVAASSAFPALFGPVEIRVEARGEFPRSELVTDGGVFDNLGITWLRHDPDLGDHDIICSDAGASLAWDSRATFRILPRRTVRVVDVLMQRVADGLVTPSQPTDGRMTLIPIADLVEESPIEPDVQKSLARIRTDLDTFEPTELSLLQAHGEWVAWKNLRNSQGTAPSKGPADLRLAPLEASAVNRLRLASARDPVTWLTVFLLAILLPLAVAWGWTPWLLDSLRRSEDSVTALRAMGRLRTLQAFMGPFAPCDGACVERAYRFRATYYAAAPVHDPRGREFSRWATGRPLSIASVLEFSSAAERRDLVRSGVSAFLGGGHRPRLDTMGELLAVVDEFGCDPRVKELQDSLLRALPPVGRASPWCEVPARTGARIGCLMGGCPQGPNGEDSQPRTVSFERFEVGCTEVSQAEFMPLLKYSVRSAAASDDPMVGLTWFEAYAHAAWQRARLPTQSEWEHAARATCAHDFWWTCGDAPVGDTLPWAQLDRAEPRGVHEGAPNPYGIRNAIGNASEWTLDWWERGRKGIVPLRSVQTNEGAVQVAYGYKAVVGGSYAMTQAESQVWQSVPVEPYKANPNVGFRLARGPLPATEYQRRDALCR